VDSFFKDVPPGTFQALERLSIRDFSEQTSPLTVFQSSPHLRTFTLKVVGRASKINLIHLPWSQLTHLRVEDNSLAGCRTALLQCNNLISANLHTSYHWDLTPEATQSPIIVLPSLETLIMTFNGEADSGPVDGLEAFFMPLALPSLTKINFTFDPDDEEVWPTEVFSEFQSRAPKIKEITLLFTSMDAHGLIALLRHAPSLTALNVEYGWNSVDDDFWDALRYDDTDSAPIAPKLQDIVFFCVGDFNEGPLEEAIRSRWWKDNERVLPDGSPPRVSRLKKVSVARHDPDDMSEGLKARMQKLVSQGLELHLP
jgi:hypothetical protein